MLLFSFESEIGCFIPNYDQNPVKNLYAARLTCLKSVQRDDSVTYEFSALLLNHEPEVGHLRQQDLLNITETLSLMKPT